MFYLSRHARRKGKRTTQAAARLRAKNGGGSILDIGSVSGIIPGVDEGTCALCKAGVINMTKSFAREMGKHHVRVDCIAPGPVESEIAGAALYFASDASRYATGAVLTIDGGLA